MNSLKLRYFFWHLITSATVVFIITVTCQYLWFPEPFLQLDGTWRALVILAVVDMVIGPLLTLFLVSSKKNNRELMVDMILILTIQISALSYGLMKIEQERVWAIVHLDGMFNLVPKKEILAEQLTENYELPKYKGIYYAMVLNDDLLLNAQEDNNLIYYSPNRYHRLSWQKITKVTIPYNDLPLDIKEKYNSKHIFKFLSGKRRDAVSVFNGSLELIDIIIINSH